MIAFAEPLVQHETERHKGIRTIVDILAPVDGEVAVWETQHIVLRLHRAYIELGLASRVRRGYYTPSTTSNAWQRRWKSTMSPVPHIWIECEGLIVDPTTAQFGEQPYSISPVGNRRYRIAFSTGPVNQQTVHRAPKENRKPNFATRDDEEETWTSI